MNYYLLTGTVNKRDGFKFVPVDSSEAQVGQKFRSWCAYPEETKKFIENQKGTRRISHLPVYMEELLIDFDNDPKASEMCEAWLCLHEIAFAVYESGNRSEHFHIAINPIEGCGVPGVVKDWVLNHFPKADVSYMTHTGLFRQAGLWHEKNPGHRKKLLRKYSGVALDIKYDESKVKKTVSKKEVDKDEKFRKARRKFRWALRQNVGEGGRRTMLWYLAAMGFDYGLDISEVFELAIKWNEKKCSPPLDPDWIVLTVESAFKRRERGL